jgi:hypothetical protein
MAQKVVLKNKGLVTDPNQLSGLPEGAMVKAENVVIDRQDIVESRRGMAQYGNTFGLPDARSKQLLVYKDRILIHYSDKLLFNDNPHNNTVDGDFEQFDGSFSELETGLRIKAIESNKNLYFTTSDGIKKISAKTAADFTTAVDFIRDAGAAKALDVTGSLNSTTEGFLPPNSKVSYRVVWAYKDNNNNQIVGSPSSKLVMSNASLANANIDLDFVIPQNVISGYFYQVYRSAVFTATGSLTLDDIFPDDELQLVIEDFPTSAQFTTGSIRVTDLAPEDLRQGGLFLYTNPNAGEGIGQANEPPPIAKDVTMYQNTLFYANTETRARTNITLLSVDDFTTGGSSITIDNSVDPAQTYTFVGAKEKTKFDFTPYVGQIPADLKGKYFLINSASNKRKYYAWFDNTKTKQVIDFANFTGSFTAPIPDLDTKFFVLYTKDPDKTYYVWLDATGSSIDPGTDSANGLTGYIGMRVPILGLTTIVQLANAVQTAIANGDIDDDFDVNYATGTAAGVTVTFGNPTLFTSASHGLETGDRVTVTASGTTPNIDGIHYITKTGVNTFTIPVVTTVGGPATWTADSSAVIVYSESFDDTQRPVVENIQKGFSFTFDTELNDDPSNDLITNTDVVGRSGFRVNVSRGVTTNAHVADALAAAIDDQDTALDFLVEYGTSPTYVEITNKNNGNTVDAVDSSINPIANSFVITVLTQGDGEDVSGVITATNTGPTVTVTSADNGLSVADTITITNSNTTPSIDGTHTIVARTKNTFDITPGSPVTIAGTSGSWKQVDNHVLLSAAVSPAQAIDETARSLVNIINLNSSDTVYAYYLSGSTDLPGPILLETKDIGTNQFTVIANNATTGAEFNPSLPPVLNAEPVIGVAETKPNRIYFAKLQQPEAVPLLNFIDVGPEDKAISRILALRESLFILKEDGVYRLTGSNGSFSVDLFDGSTKILAPDSAITLNNLVYCLTNLGIVSISDTGVSVISNPIASTIQLLTSSNYNYKFTSFGVSYENDNSYLLFMPSSKSDTIATIAFRHNTYTSSFTTFKMSKTCGIVNASDDKLYLGTSDTNYIERERKLFNRTDFADRNFDLIVPSNSVDGTTLRLSSSVSIDIGDAVVQSQYLTIAEYNQLLKKLDLDPSIGDAEVTNFDYASYSGSIPSSLHSKYFILYSASDAKRYAVFYDAQGDLPSLDTNVFNDISDADQIRVDISSGVTTKALLAQATKTAIQSATFDFIVAYTSGNEFFQTTTIRNGNTSDAIDSAVNGVLNGFAITILNQGVGDYFDDLEMEQGNNIYAKLNALATKLDADPGIAQTDYLASIGTYSAVGSIITFGSPNTLISEVAHGLQDGRLVTISNSTSTPSINGDYVITRVDANNFTIPIATTVGGTCNWSANLTTFTQAQAAFNTIVNKLNIDTGVSYQNYLLSEDVKEFEVLILDKALNTTDVVMQFSMPLLEGPITVYKGIPCDVQYSPETFGDTSMLKQVTESTVIFEDANFSRATVGFKTDLSPGFETVNFTKSGKGDFGFFTFSQHNWGGGFSGVPLRTYIPRQKQRNRYIQLEFLHDSSREHFALYGFSYTFRAISERAYRG